MKIYFWKIQNLKTNLINAGLNKWQIAFYLIAILIIQTVPYYLISEPINFWDNVDTAIFYIFLGVGTIYCYQANGGAGGKSFLERYISLAWVFGIRYTCFVFIPVFMILYLLVGYTGSDVPDETNWYDTTIVAIIRIGFYIALARHVRDVAHNKIKNENTFFTQLSKHVPTDNTVPYDPSQYPNIARRYLATFIDGLFIITIFVLIAYLFQGTDKLSVTIRLLTAFFMFFVYEPICTSKLCTIGQKILGVRIRSLQANQNISIVSAYIRIVVKIMLGIISFFTIPYSKNKRAIHDFAAGSVVIYSTPNS